jgi:hypothetical protein
MFSGLFKPQSPATAIGFGNGTVSAVSLQKAGRNRFGIRRAATTEIPDGLLIPSFDQSNISDADSFVRLLDGLAVDAGLGGQNKWSAALPAATARTAIITLDETPGSRTELNEVLDWKTETSFGVGASEMRVSRYPISSSDKGKTRYFATAVKLAVLEEYENAFDELGWKVGMIVPKAVGESNWFSRTAGDSLLISAQSDGFTALLMRNSEPVVVRSVTCAESELDDEIYRLLVYYQDRVAAGSADGRLSRLLVLGEGVDSKRVDAITSEAIGEVLNVLRPDDIGFEIPVNGLSFEDLAAPAGLATLKWR